MIPRSTTLTAEGARLRRVLVWTVVAVVAGNLFVALIGPLLRGERVTGPFGSSYVTTALGAAAFAELLDKEGVDVDRLRGPIIPGRLDPNQTLIMIELGFIDIPRPELDTLIDFVESGGRLLLVGPPPRGVVEGVAPNGVAPEWNPNGSDSGRAALSGVDLVPLSGQGELRSWDGEGIVLRGQDGDPVAVEWTKGRGSVAWVADSEPFLNRGLAARDSAGFAVSLAGDDRVVFDEYHHGFGGDGLFDALPEGWATTLLLLAGAGLAWMIAYGRRLGPPEQASRDLAPERAAYVDSLAGILGRTGRFEEAVAPVSDRARRLLAKRAGLGPGASDEDIRRAADEAGIPSETVERWQGQGDPLAAGEVLARLSDRR